MAIWPRRFPSNSRGNPTRDKGGVCRSELPYCIEVSPLRVQANLEKLRKHFFVFCFE